MIIIIIITIITMTIIIIIIIIMFSKSFANKRFSQTMRISFVLT